VDKSFGWNSAAMSQSSTALDGFQKFPVDLD
jgi:hypothetical protein